MRRIAILVALVAACKEPAPRPSSPPPVDAAVRAPPAIDASSVVGVDAAGLDVGEPLSKARIGQTRADGVRGQLVRGGVTVDLATREMFVEHSACRERADGDYTKLLDDSGLVLQVHLPGDQKIVLGKPVNARRVDLEVYVSDSARKSTRVDARGTVTFHKRGAHADFELDLDLGKSGHIEGRITGATVMGTLEQCRFY